MSSPEITTEIALTPEWTEPIASRIEEAITQGFESLVELSQAAALLSFSPDNLSNTLIVEEFPDFYDGRDYKELTDNERVFIESIVLDVLGLHNLSGRDPIRVYYTDWYPIIEGKVSETADPKKKTVVEVYQTEKSDPNNSLTPYLHKTITPDGRAEFFVSTLNNDI